MDIWVKNSTTHFRRKKTADVAVTIEWSDNSWTRCQKKIDNFAQPFIIRKAAVFRINQIVFNLMLNNNQYTPAID